MRISDGVQTCALPICDLPYHWTKVFDRGAGRGLHNEVAGTLCEFKGALYVASGVINGGYHRAFRIGPAAAEIMRFWPDDSWDLIMCESRTNDKGLKYPLYGITQIGRASCRARLCQYG